jgi:hypothetical protein
MSALSEKALSSQRHCGQIVEDVTRKEGDVGRR